MRVEEVEQRNGAAVPGRCSRACARRPERRVDRPGRGDGARERACSVELDVQPGSQHEPHLAEARAQVERADRQRGRCAAGPGDAAEAGAGGAVVAAGRDHERVEAHRTGRSSREWPVCEAGERLCDTDERDARCVVRVAVIVRVDGALDAGEQLVGASVDRPPGGCVTLPAGGPEFDRLHAVEDGIAWLAQGVGVKGCERSEVLAAIGALVERLGGQRVMCAAHAAAGRRGFSLWNGHGTAPLRSGSIRPARLRRRRSLIRNSAGAGL